MKANGIDAVLICVLLLPAFSTAADHYVAVDGKADNVGSESSPWDLASALGGAQQVAPGDTIWVRGGTYKHPDRQPGSNGYRVKLSGAAGKPIHVRPVPGERVTLDGGLAVQNPSQFVWIWDLEILVSENLTRTRVARESGSHPKDMARPWGSLNVVGGESCKYIHLVVHDNAQGIGFWKPAVDSEVYGCLVYDNGWIGPDRYHGPGIYGQNQTGTKLVTDNIFFGNYSNTTQFYGSSRAYVDNFHIEGNVAFGPRKQGGRYTVLIGGGRGSRGIVVKNNILYEVPLSVGYTAKDSEDCVVEGNTIIRHGLSIRGFRDVTERNNFVWRGRQQDSVPETASTWLRPSKYDPDRANLAVANWPRTETVDVDASRFLQPGDTFRVQNVLDFFGKPLVHGTYEGKPVSIPMPVEERTGQGEFCAFVVFRERRARR
jgi:hypothetical protein